MQRMMLGSCNDSLLFPCCATAVAEDLARVRFADNGTFGMAVVNEHDMLLRKRPVPPKFEPTPILEDLHTNLFMMMQEDATPGNFRATRALPVRYRGWVFGLTGLLPEPVADADGPLAADLPGFLRHRRARGFHGAAVFAWSLGRLYATGLLDSGPGLGQRALGALTDAVRKLKEVTGLGALPFSFALGNPQYAVGYVGESSVQALRLEGIEHCTRCSDPMGTRRVAPHDHVRMNVLASVPEKLPRPWERVAPGLCFLLRSDGTFESEPALA